MTTTSQSVAVNTACCAGETVIDQGQNQAGKRTLVLLATDRLGKGDDDLGQKIVINFIKTMKEMGDDLWRLVLLNAGVKLAVAGSEALPELQRLAKEGLGILVCGPCLKTFNLFEKRQVGELTSMVDIVTSMQIAEKVISLT